jgi:hypothetical protein
VISRKTCVEIQTKILRQQKAENLSKGQVLTAFFKNSNFKQGNTKI